MTYIPRAVLCLSVFFSILCSSAFLSHESHAAAPLVVNSIADPGNGVCDAAECTLREAIAAANATAGDDTITFASDVSGTINLTGALPVLSTNITLTGPGANLLTVKRATGGDYSVFAINGGVAVTISGLTITNGKASGGGGIFVGPTGTLRNRLVLERSVVTGNTAGNGGGVFNQGISSVIDSTISDNFSSSPGGGLWNGETLYVKRSAIIRNTTNSYLGGGGILNRESAGVSIENCDVSANNAVGSGGGVNNQGLMFAVNSTIVDNTISTSGTGGGITGGGGLTMGNSIVFRNRNSSYDSPSADISGTFTSRGHNLVGSRAGSGGYIASDLPDGTDPQLGTLQNNGGFSPTHALLPGSPAIDTGSNALAKDSNDVPLIVEQRGTTRFFDAHGDGEATTDIGAYEYDATFPNVHLSSTTFAAAEGTTANLIVRRRGLAGAGESVNLIIADGTATAGANSDYEFPAGATIATDGTQATVTVSFAEGETEKTVSLTINDDTLDETNETIKFSLAAPSGSIFLGSPRTALLTITDTDAPPTIAINDVEIREGRSGIKSAVSTLTLSTASALPVSVKYALADGSATVNSDYVALPISGTNIALNKPASQSSTDADAVAARAVDGSISDYYGAYAARTNREAQPWWQVDLGTNQLIGEINVRGNSGIPNVPFRDFYVFVSDTPFASASLSETLNQPGVSSYYYFRADNNKPGTTVPVGRFGRYVRVQLGYTDKLILTEVEVFASDTLTFAPGETVKTITVNVAGDTIAETDETLFINLSNPRNATFTDAQGIVTIHDGELVVSGVLAPVADAYVKGATPTTNYGTMEELQVKRTYNAGSGRGRQSFLRFDTSSVTGTIGRATLRVYGRLNALTPGNRDIPIAVFPVSAEWDELVIDWTNKARPNLPQELRRATVPDDTPRWYEFDITDFINAERAAGRTTTGVLLRNMTSGEAGDFYTVFNSREAAANQPQLVIEQ
jgi:CSLREA domain-containing protein